MKSCTKAELANLLKETRTYDAEWARVDPVGFNRWHEEWEKRRDAALAKLEGGQ